MKGGVDILHTLFGVGDRLLKSAVLGQSFSSRDLKAMNLLPQGIKILSHGLDFVTMVIQHLCLHVDLLPEVTDARQQALA